LTKVVLSLIQNKIKKIYVKLNSMLVT